MNAPRLSFASITASAFFLIGSYQLNGEIAHGPIYNPETGNVYFLLTQNTWTASEVEAQILGGHLAAISDNAEQNWIYRTFGVEFGGGRLLWIGLNDAADEGIFRWTRDEEFAYSAWTLGEPNGTQPTEDFVAIYYSSHSAQGRWNDWSNIQSDPIGIPFMGVAEVHPRDFQPRLRTIHFLDLENADAMHFLPAPVPSSAYLTDQYRDSHGVVFSSGSEPAVAVRLGESHATSGLNGFAGMTNGVLNYSAPVHLSFWTPSHPDLAATSDFVSVRLDQLDGGDGPVRLSAYDLAGELLVSTNVSDIGGRPISLSSPGMHSVIFQGNGSAAVDDLWLGNLTSTRPILNIKFE